MRRNKNKQNPSWPSIYPIIPRERRYSDKGRQIYEEFGYRCIYCGFRLLRYASDDPLLKNYMATIDHILPKARGGANNDDNKAPCCAWCNHSKGSRTNEEFRQALMDNEFPELLKARYKFRTEIYGKVYDIDWEGKFYIVRFNSGSEMKRFRGIVDLIQMKQIQEIEHKALEKGEKIIVMF